jgi:hypothetical protein
MTPFEETAADYAATHLTPGPHVMTHLRDRLRAAGILAARDLDNVPHGTRVRVAGHVIVRQRPGTAKGFVFLTLEDETGTANAVVTRRATSAGGSSSTPHRCSKWRARSSAWTASRTCARRPCAGSTCPPSCRTATTTGDHGAGVTVSVKGPWTPKPIPSTMIVYVTPAVTVGNILDWKLQDHRCTPTPSRAVALADGEDRIERRSAVSMAAVPTSSASTEGARRRPAASHHE